MEIALPAPFQFVYVDQTTSTMDAVMEEALAGDAWPFLAAGRQMQARGRHGRPWQAPVGNFMASFRVPIPQDKNPSTLSLIVGMAVQKALMNLAPEATIQLKWPNDVVAQNQHGQWGKFGGILVETKGVGTDRLEAVVGVGLNLTHAPEKLPHANPLLPQAFKGVDVRIETTVSDVSKALCDSFLSLFNTWKMSADFAPFVEDYNSMLWRINEEIYVSHAVDKSDEQTIINRGIDATGQLQEG